MPTPPTALYFIRCTKCAQSVYTTKLKPISNWICRNCDGSYERRIMWSNLWHQALANMPAMAICHVTEKDVARGQVQLPYSYRRGSATALRMCLGYQVYSARGRSNASYAHYNAMKHGSKPRGANRQHMLRALAGPHGAVIARARLIQIGQAHRFSIWPIGTTND